MCISCIGRQILYHQHHLESSYNLNFSLPQGRHHAFASPNLITQLVKNPSAMKEIFLGKICWKRNRLLTPIFMGFPGGSDSKESACNAGELGLISGLGRSPGEGNGNPLQCSCLKNPMDRGTWWATVNGVSQSRTRLK